MGYFLGWYWDEKSKEWLEYDIPDVSHVKEKQFRATIDARRFPRLPFYTLGQFIFGLFVCLFLLSNETMRLTTLYN